MVWGEREILERKETRKINFLLRTQPPRQPGEQSVSLRCCHGNRSMCERGRGRGTGKSRACCRGCQSACLSRLHPSRATRAGKQKGVGGVGPGLSYGPCVRFPLLEVPGRPHLETQILIVAA